MKTIIILIDVLYIIPWAVSAIISSLRKRIETDRNFYGHDIREEDIELKNVKYKKYRVHPKDFEKYMVDGKIEYHYKHCVISKEDYKKLFPEDDIKETWTYYPEFIFTYNSDKGLINASIAIFHPTLTKEYRTEDVVIAKQLLYDICQDKAFAKIPSLRIYDRYNMPSLANHVFTDYKGNQLIHEINTYGLSKARFKGQYIDVDVSIIGESKIQPGKWDWLFYDYNWYPKDDKMEQKNKFLTFCSRLNMNMPRSYYVNYLMLGISWFNFNVYERILFKTNGILSLLMYSLILVVIPLAFASLYIVSEALNREQVQKLPEKSSSIRNIVFLILLIITMISYFFATGIIF
jgi:hypothetical protein